MFGGWPVQVTGVRLGLRVWEVRCRCSRRVTVMKMVACRAHNARPSAVTVNASQVHFAQSGVVSDPRTASRSIPMHRHELPPGRASLFVGPFD